MKKLLWMLILAYGTVSTGFSQRALVSDPTKAQFIDSDIARFWQAFDQMSSVKNPFNQYMKEGSPGLKDFVPFRIKNGKQLNRIVRKKKASYAAIRKNSLKVKAQYPPILKAFQNFKELYPKAVFPTTYFIIGAFNTGGTISKHGLIIGVEKQQNIEEIPFIVAHELIHFNQKYPRKRYSLLETSIKEGSADFLGELIAGKHINTATFAYGNAHEAELCAEFVKIMNDTKYRGWLYGTRGRKKGRPKNLGYWMGYQICKAYYQQASDKKEAIRAILNIQDFDSFLAKSGYLAKYLQK